MWEKQATRPVKYPNCQSKSWNQGVARFNDSDQEFRRYLEDKIDEGFKPILFKIFNTDNYVDLMKRLRFCVGNYEEDGWMWTILYPEDQWPSEAEAVDIDSCVVKTLGK